MHLSTLTAAAEIKLIGANETITPPQQAFIDTYIETINSKDTSYYKKNIMHPDCLGRLNKYPEILAFFMENRFKHSIPEKHTNSIKDMDDETITAFKKSFIYPIHPSHMIMINYQKTESKEASILIQAIKQGDEYFEVQPYPKAETLEKLKKAKIADEKQTKRVKKLFFELKDPFLSELKILINQNQKISAMKKYSTETGESLDTAKMIIDFLIEDNNNQPSHK